MSSPEERERRLNILGCSFGRDLDVEIRREKTNLRNSLAQDFEREMVLAEACASHKWFWLKHALVIMIFQEHYITG
jgi:hypothetical protein